MTMIFPSDVQIYRTDQGAGDCVVSLYYPGGGLRAAGKGMAAAEKQASEWFWANMERRTDAWAELTKLERAFRLARERLSPASPD